MKKFFEKSKNGTFYRQFLWTFKGTAFITGLDSALVLAIPIFMILMKGIGIVWLSGLLTLLICGIYLFAIEGTLYVLLVPTLTAIFNADWNKLASRQRKAFQGLLSLSVAVIVFAFCVTIGVTLYLRESASEIVTAPPKITDIAKMKGEADSVQLVKISAVDAEIKRIEKARDTELSGVTKKTAKLLPYGVGGSWLDRQNKLKSDERANQRAFDAQKAEIMAKYDLALSKQRESKIKVLTDTTATASIAAVAAVNGFNMDQFKAHAKTWSTLIMWLSIGATILMVVTGVALSLFQASLNTGSFERIIDFIKEGTDTAASAVTSAVSSVGSLSTPIAGSPALSVASATTTAPTTERRPIGFVQQHVVSPVTTETKPVTTVIWTHFNDLPPLVQQQQLQKYGGPFTNEAFQYAVKTLNPRFGQAEQGWLMNSDDSKAVQTYAMAYDAAKEAEKPVVTTPKPVITENTAKTEDDWVNKLETVEVDGETFSPNEIIKAKTSIIVYHNRSITSAKPETRETNRKKAETFRKVLEATGLNVQLNPDGTGKVYV